MRKHSLLLAAAALVTFMSQAHADCTPSEDLIGQAQVSNLRGEADTADQRASMSATPSDQMRWRQMAENFRSQADMLERNQQALANAAQQACGVLSNDGQ
jgi:hypothetical protein